MPKDLPEDELSDFLTMTCANVIAKNSDVIKIIKCYVGDSPVKNVLVGMVAKETGGKYDMGLIRETIERLLQNEV